ncbi:MAG: hypothetical protein J6Q64_03000, partial [Clostridia bacterium]|nr:hypothetical protein [Clostridia bacterium]
MQKISNTKPTRSEAISNTNPRFANIPLNAVKTIVGLGFDRFHFGPSAIFLDHPAGRVALLGNFFLASLSNFSPTSTHFLATFSSASS